MAAQSNYPRIEDFEAQQLLINAETGQMVYWYRKRIFGLFQAPLARFSMAISEVYGLLSERLPRHFNIDQYIANGAVSFGGGYQGNLLSFDIGEQVLWVANSGFEKALAVTATLQLSRITLHGGLNVLPGGKIVYSGYGNSFLQTAGLASSNATHAAE